MRSNSKKMFLYSLSALGSFSILGGDLLGLTYHVPVGGAIQSYINMASNGDTIKLGAGNYGNQKIQVIYKNINIEGGGMGTTVITSPSAPALSNTFQYSSNGTLYRPIIMVDSCQVNISGLTINGNNQGDFAIAPNFVGIGYHNASGSLTNVEIVDVQDYDHNSGHDEGIAVAAVSDKGTNHLNIRDCKFNNFQKQAVLNLGAGQTFIISGSKIIAGESSFKANGNGIEVRDGATGRIENNIISNIRGENGASAAISAAKAHDLTISDNSISKSDVGIYCNSCVDNLLISNNQVNDNSDTGIYLLNENSSAGSPVNLKSNTISANKLNGVYIYDTIGNDYQFTHNIFSGGENNLVVEGGNSLAPTVKMNHDTFTGASRYFIQEINSPNNIWPTTESVSFDGLLASHLTLVQFNKVLTKIYDKHKDATLGLVLDHKEANVNKVKETPKEEPKKETPKKETPKKEVPKK